MPLMMSEETKDGSPEVKQKGKRTASFGLTGMTCATCAHDCGACPSVCGDGACSGAETCLSCAADCGACPPFCGDGVCG